MVDLPRDERSVQLQNIGVTDPFRSATRAAEGYAYQSQITGNALTQAGDALIGEATRISVDRARQEAEAAPLQRDAEGNLIAPPAASPLDTAASVARREVTVQRQVSSLIGTANADLVRMRREAGEDPQRFLDAASTWMNRRVQEVAGPLRPLLGRALRSAVEQHHTNLLAVDDQRQKEAAGEALLASLRQLHVDGSNLRAQGQSDATQRAAIETQIAAAEQSHIISPRVAATLRRNMLVIGPIQSDIRRGLAAETPGEAGGEGYVRAIFGAEGGPQGQRAANPRSSARGAGQFIDGTWERFVDQNPNLPLFEGLSREARLALRTADSDAGRAAQREAVLWYARVNRAVLLEAQLPVTNATLALSHRFDGPVAVRILRADPAAPIASIVGERVMAANPDLGRLGTVGAVVEHYRSRFGGASQTLEALRTGPGTPGWNPAWNSLSQEERDQIARTEGALVAARREDWRFERAQTELAREAEVSRLALEAARIRASSEPLSAEQMGRLAEITDQIGRVSPGSGVAALRGLGEERRQQQALGEQAATDAGRQALIGEARQAVTALLEGEGGEQSPRFGQALRMTDQMTLPQQAAYWGHFREQLEREAQQAATDAQHRGRFALAALGNGAQVPNDERNQRYAMEMVEQAGGLDAVTGDANDPVVAVLAQAARGGVLPQQVVGRVEGAIRTGNTQAVLAWASAIERIGQASTEARQRLNSSMSEDLRQALSFLGNSLLPGGEQAQDRNRALYDEAKRILEGRAARREDVLGSHAGPDPQQQQKWVTEHLDQGARSVLGLSWIDSEDSRGRSVRSIDLPRAFRQEAEAALVRNLARGLAPEQASRDAIRDVMAQGRWSLSGTTLGDGGLSNVRFRDPAALGAIGDAVFGLVGAAVSSVAPGLWPRGVEPRLVRNAAERLTIERNGQHTTDWQQEVARRLAADGGIVGDVRLGSNVFWQPVDGQGDRYRLRALVGGAPAPVYRRVGGVLTGEEVIVDLRAERDRYANPPMQGPAQDFLREQQAQELDRERAAIRAMQERIRR